MQKHDIMLEHSSQLILGWCRPDGSTLFLIFSDSLHMFDEAMLTLPFATRTDMHGAMRNSNGKNELI